MQKAESHLEDLKQDTAGQLEAQSISKALEQEDILKHRDQVRVALQRCNMS